MYGKRKYRPLQKAMQPIVKDDSLPTFQCAKCKALKQQITGFTDLSVTQDGRVKILGRICSSCIILLETWVRA